MSGHEARQDGTEPSLAARLRMAADSELGEPEREALESHLARSLEDRARIQFERELRDSVGRVMGGVRAPESLRARVGEIIAASREDAAGRAETPVVSHQAHQSHEDRGPARLASHTRQRSFWTRRHAMGALVAAAVLVVASVFIVRMASITRVPLNAAQESYRAELVHHVANEHRRMEDPEARDQKLVMHDPEEVERFFDEVIDAPEGDVKDLIESTAGCAFSGAGNCHVPGATGASAHIQLDVKVGAAVTPVSVFVCADPGELPLQVGTTYVIDTEACGEGKTRVLAWTDGRLLYVVVSGTVHDACPSILARLGRPSPSRRL
ncbi:MAG: hypothetical protein R3B57_06715 [Phycisphaerales bacterium]